MTPDHLNALYVERFARAMRPRRGRAAAFMADQLTNIGGGGDEDRLMQAMLGAAMGQRERRRTAAQERAAREAERAADQAARKEELASQYDFREREAAAAAAREAERDRVSWERDQSDPRRRQAERELSVPLDTRTVAEREAAELANRKALAEHEWGLRNKPLESAAGGLSQEQREAFADAAAQRGDTQGALEILRGAEPNRTSTERDALINAGVASVKSAAESNVGEIGAGGSFFDPIALSRRMPLQGSKGDLGEPFKRSDVLEGERMGMRGNAMLAAARLIAENPRYRGAGITPEELVQAAGY